MMQTAVDSFGRLDVLVNNAGMETRQSLLETTEADYEKVMAVNMKSAFFGSQAAAKRFIEQGDGGLSSTSPRCTRTGRCPGNIAYCVSKGGMRMLTRTAGVELGPHGIRMVNIAPGAVDTPINASTTSNKELLGKLEDAIPLRRLAESSDIADVAVFLASGKAVVHDRRRPSWSTAASCRAASGSDRGAPAARAEPAATLAAPVGTWRAARARSTSSPRAVAQLVEQRSPKPQVAGSSPVRPAKAAP